MAVAQVMDTRINPNNPAQRVVLWSNARTDVYGAPPIVGGPAFYDRPDQPIVVAIWIINWQTMAGYMLDKHGGFHPFGGAPAVGEKSTVRDTDTHYVVVGVPYLVSGLWYWDWQWDPEVPGRGVALDVFGNLHVFGGVPAPPRTGRRWASPMARKLAVRFRDANGNASMRAYTLGYDGSINADYAGTVAVTSPFRWNADQAVDLTVTNWDTGSGYMLDRNGGTWAFGQATGTYSPGYNLGADIARCLEVTSPANPLSFWRVGPSGQETEWTWSTPPTVVAGGDGPVSPASTVTGTTRPVLAWSYSDLQSDSQVLVELLVFTSTFVSANNMGDPAVHRKSALVDFTTTDPMLRGVASPVDLRNGSYRMYVRAKDSSERWSPWANRAWTQNVPVPATPTGMSATANSNATVILRAAATATGAGNLLRFEHSDDGGATWAAVDGADALSVAVTVTGADRFPPQGATRRYRAVRYSIDPRTASLPSNTATANVPVVGHLLHATDDTALGGRIRVQEPLEWTRPVGAGAQYGIDAQYATVIKDGAPPKGRRGSLNLLSLDTGMWQLIARLAESRSTLVFRDPFGTVMYCEIVGDWAQRQMRAAPTMTEGTPLRHAHTSPLPLVEVRPPHQAT